MAQDLEKTDGAANPTSAADADATSTLPGNLTPGDATAKSTETTQAPVARTNWFRRFLWLDARLAEVSSHHLGPTQSGWREFELAREARTALDEITELGENSFHALLLVRNEVLLLVRSYMLQRGLLVPKVAMSTEDWARARQVPLIADVWNKLTINQVATIEDCFGPEGETYLIGLNLQQRTELTTVMKESASILMKPLESDASQIGRVLAQRWLRLGVASAIVFVGLWNFTHWILDRSGSVNLALNSSVTTSSQEPGVGLDHHLLVDGDHTNMGFHTQAGPNQFVVIDLGSVKKFDKVVVYNRVECCKERAVPLAIEVSDDGTNYKKLAERREVFDVWTADRLRGQGRYVRLRLIESNILHLNEVEIY